MYIDFLIKTSDHSLVDISIQLNQNNYVFESCRLFYFVNQTLFKRQTYYQTAFVIWLRKLNHVNLICAYMMKINSYSTIRDPIVRHCHITSLSVDLS